MSTGTAALGGTLSLNFANGYIPAEGDTFAFIQAASTTGTFDEVTVAGLPPSFKFNVNTANGVISFVITDDGGFVPPANGPKLYLPVVQK